MQPAKAVMEYPKVAIEFVDRAAMMMPNVVMKYEMNAAGPLVCAFIEFSNIESSIKVLALGLGR